MDKKYYVSKERVKYLTEYNNVKIKNHKDISTPIVTVISDLILHIEDKRERIPQSARIYSPILSVTLTSKGGGDGAKTGLYKTKEEKVRRLTPTECERLQAFPDGWTEGISDSQRYYKLGNAVTTTVVTGLINKMFKNSKYERGNNGKS